MILGDWIEVFQEFNEIAGDNWKLDLNRMLRGKEPDCSCRSSQIYKDLSTVFNRLVITVKSMILEGNEGTLAQLKKLLHNDILYDLLMQYEEEHVSAFDCYAEKLSFLYLKGVKEIGDELIEDIFANVIIQINSAIYEKYDYYGFGSDSEFKKLASMLDSLVMTAVRRRLGAADFKAFLSYKFTRESEMVKKLTQQYTLYYPQLRERYSLELNERKEEMQEKISPAS